MGMHTTRAGYAGEDAPRAMFPTQLGYIDGQDGEDVSMDDNKRQYYIGDNLVNKFKPNMSTTLPLKDGLIEDWDAVENIWNATFRSMLGVQPEDHPLLCTEPAWNSKDNREKILELAFNTFSFPAFYLAQDAVMSAFSVGRGTALVLDSGAGKTSVVPVYEGYVLKKGILHQPVGGDLLTEKIQQYLAQELDYQVTPHYNIANKQPVGKGQPPQIQNKTLQSVTESYHNSQVNRALNEFKETICEVSDLTYDETQLESRNKKVFEFPDGYNRDFGIERYRLSELLFQPKLSLGQETEYIGVHEMVYNSVSSCDADLRPLLLNNIVVTGGNSLLNGFNERLNYELPLKAPGSKIKIHASGNMMERKSSSWLGGSILASLGTFHQLWISKKEYEEFGNSVLQRKC
ncbi:actin family [Sporodiniella umbellata]|nr:actin family [Sporodiniella umbellata]